MIKEYDTYFFLILKTLLPLEKIIVGKISHRGGVGGPIDLVQFEKNRLKFRFLLYKSM